MKKPAAARVVPSLTMLFRLAAAPGCNITNLVKVFNGETCARWLGSGAEPTCAAGFISRRQKARHTTK